MSGAAENGGIGVKVLILSIFQRWNPRQTHACRSQRFPVGDT